MEEKNASANVIAFNIEPGSENLWKYVLNIN